MILAFIRKNRLLSVILLISIFIITKFSKISYLPYTPGFIRHIFEMPPENTSSYEVYSLLDNLSLAYIASLMFYVIVDYMPKKKMAYKSLRILDTKLVSLYLYLSEIISSVNTEIGLVKDIKEITDLDVEILDDFKFKHESSFIRSYSCIDGVKNDTCTKLEFDFRKDIPKYVRLVRKTIDNIKNMPCIAHVDFELIELLSILESNRVLQQLEDLKNEPDNVHFKHHNFADNYYRLIEDLKRFDQFDFRKHTYIKEVMTDEERDGFITERDRLRKEASDSLGDKNFKRILNGIQLE